MKYTRDALQTMALQTMMAQATNDERFHQLVLGLAVRLGIGPQTVIFNIQRLAAGQL